MPNIPSHLRLASEAARRLAHPVVDRHMGCFLLGATTPDIRAMTKWPRDQTHFAPLDIQHVGTGVQGLLQAYPDLADSSHVNDATKVFLSGYFTHLVADEAWIVDIYRTCFDGHEALEDRLQADIWDRALQLDMDRAAWAYLGGVDQVRPYLIGSEGDVTIGFISEESLGQWREWVSEFITWEFTWERLRFATRRKYRDSAEAMKMVDEFLEGMPGSLERVYTEVPVEKIAAFQEKSIEKSIQLIKEYLGVPQGNQGTG